MRRIFVALALSANLFSVCFAHSHVSDSSWAKGIVTEYKLKGFDPLLTLDTSQVPLSKLQIASIAFVTCRHMSEVSDRLSSKIKVLEDLVNRSATNQSESDVSKLRKMVSDLKIDSLTVTSWANSISRLRSIVRTCNAELKTLGADPLWMAETLRDLSSRLTQFQQRAETSKPKN